MQIHSPIAHKQPKISKHTKALKVLTGFMAGLGAFVAACNPIGSCIFGIMAVYYSRKNPSFYTAQPTDIKSRKITKEDIKSAAIMGGIHFLLFPLGAISAANQAAVAAMDHFE